jgi:hypothetical protein
MENKKVVILILSLDQEPYLSLERGIRETWLRNESPDAVSFFYHGDNDINEIDGDIIKLNCAEGLTNIGRKTILAFEEILKAVEFDYIFRTNSSSYVHIPKLIEYLVDKPKNGFYHGFLGFHKPNSSFASGSGYFLSKDLVKKVISNKQLWNHETPDDLALADLLQSLGVKATPAPRLDLLEVDSAIHTIDNFNLSDYYHFRCKTCGDRSGDITIMQKLYSKITK